MKFFLFHLVLIAGWLSAAQLAEAAASDAAKFELFPSKVAARGKGFEIKQSQIDEAFAAYRGSAAASGQVIPEAKRAEIEAQILDRLINVQLLMVKATPADKAKGKEAGEALYEDYVKRAASPEAFRRQVTSLGMTVDEFRQRMIEEATFKEIIDREVKSQITITTEQAKKFYDENPSQFDLPERVRASHILFLTQNPNTRQELSDSAKKEKRALAERVLGRIRGGEDFAKLARELSEDEGSRVRGGELPLFTKGRMVPEFESAAFSMATNQVSDIVNSQFGYHIIKLHEKLPARKVPFEEVEKDLKESLAMQEAQSRLPQFLKKLREEAAVEILIKPGT